MAVIANAKMWSMILQMILLVQFNRVEAAKYKRTPYSVQESNHEFSSGSDFGSYAPWSETFSSSLDSGGGHFIKSRGSFGGGSSGFYPSQIGVLSGFGMQDSSSAGSFDSLKTFGKQISEGPHFISSGGKSLNELQDDVSSKFHALVLESKLKLKLAEEKVAQMRKEFGRGTFGYQGYEYPIKFGPIDLGTHPGVDLGTTLDSKSIKDSNGKLKLPVQTVLITKTLGVPIPEPYPIKQEVAVPAPYPVPIPSHYSSESYPSSYSSDYSGDSGKSSYSNGGVSLSKVVQYHENLPKASEKHYASASNNYVRYLPAPSRSSTPSTYRTSFTSSQYSSAPKQSVYEFK